jgi:hypothetical protein
MSNGQLFVGIALLLFSALLRAWKEVNLRHPLKSRPVAFQSQRFLSSLSMISSAFFVLGLLSLVLFRFWIGLALFILYFVALTPFLVFILGKVFK